MQWTWRSAAGACVLVALAGFAQAAEVAPPTRPLVIANRGASGYLPEHTIEAYSLAIDQGADFIAVELVSTRDGTLIARHENELSDTTDVAAKFPDRKVTKTIEGRSVEGWFAEDFTAAEIKTLRVKERLPFRNQTNSGQFQIPTFTEVLELRARKTDDAGHAVGIYAETRHPTYFAGIGLALEEPMLAALRAAGLEQAAAQVFLQSRDAASLRKLKGLSAMPRILTVDAPERVTDAAIAEIATYAQGIAPDKALIVPADRNGITGTPTDLVARAHRAGLVVHPFAFRPEPQFLPAAYGEEAGKEICQFARLGADGLFADMPDMALKALRKSCPMSAGRP